MASNRRATEEAIHQAALDYAEGYYEGDVQRMQRCLHPGLAKRQLSRDLQTGQWVFEHYTKADLVGFTKAGNGTSVPRDLLFYQIDILDVYNDMAMVRCESARYVDYLHLAREDGRWLIVNVLYSGRQSVGSQDPRSGS